MWTDDITKQTLHVYSILKNFRQSQGTLKVTAVTYLPSMVSGWAVKIWGFTAKRVPSTTRVTFSGATVWELLLEDNAQHPWRSWVLKYSNCLLFPSGIWQLWGSSGADSMLLIWGLTGQVLCRHSESRPEGHKQTLQGEERIYWKTSFYSNTSYWNEKTESCNN